MLEYCRFIASEHATVAVEIVSWEEFQSAVDQPALVYRKDLVLERLYHRYLQYTLGWRAKGRNDPEPSKQTSNLQQPVELLEKFLKHQKIFFNGKRNLVIFISISNVLSNEAYTLKSRQHIGRQNFRSHRWWARH